MNQIYLKNIIVDKNKITYDYTAKGFIADYLNLNEKFFIAYSENISNVPKSILVIPFLCNMLPISWVCNTEIKIDEIDKDFYNSIKEFKQGYIDMYPKVNFKGSLLVNSIIDNSYEPTNKTASFFSGGVDAFNTLISHYKERPTLITLWGADVKLTDIKGWQIVKEHALETAKAFNTQNLFIKTSFRKFLKEGKLGNLVYKKAKDYWWHGFQHGIGIIGHIAPYAYKYKLGKIYIASSNTIKEKNIITCASDPTIDNYLKMASCNVIHDGYEFSRLNKVHNIVQFMKQTGINFELRVCWESEGGRNCCNCEKCYRTIYEIIAEEGDLKKLGFEIDNTKKIEYDIKNKIILHYPFYWNEIQQIFIEKKELFCNNTNYKWIYETNFNKLTYKKTFFNKIKYWLQQKLKH